MLKPELITSARRGDPAAQLALITAFTPLIRSLERSEFDPSAREDLRSILTLALLEAIRRFGDRDPAIFPGYVKKYLTNTVRSYRRGEKRRRDLEERVKREQTETTCELESPLEEAPLPLKAVAARLLPRERALLRARFVEKQTLAEIARAAKLPASTVHYRIDAALHKLRSALKACR